MSKQGQNKKAQAKFDALAKVNTVENAFWPLLLVNFLLYEVLINVKFESYLKSIFDNSMTSIETLDGREPSSNQMIVPFKIKIFPTKISTHKRKRLLIS